MELGTAGHPRGPTARSGGRDRGRRDGFSLLAGAVPPAWRCRRAGRFWLASWSTAASLGDTIDCMLGAPAWIRLRCRGGPGCGRHRTSSSSSWAVGSSTTFLAGFVRGGDPGAVWGFMSHYYHRHGRGVEGAPPRGAMRRAERADLLVFAAGLTPFSMALASDGDPLESCGKPPSSCHTR